MHNLVSISIFMDVSYTCINDHGYSQTRFHFLICIFSFVLQSGFEGFIRDKYTLLPETRERILATEVSASWTYDFYISVH